MSIHRKVTALLLLMMLVVGLAHTIVEKLIIMPSFYELEREHAQDSIRRAQEALQGEIDHLGVACRDWASWDDTYDYVVSRDRSYEVANLQPTSCLNLEINAQFLFDAEGRQIHGLLIDTASGAPLTADPLSNGAILGPHPLLVHRTLESMHSGILMTSAGPMIVCSRPILTSERQGPARGTLLFGRMLDARLWERIRNQLRLDLQIFALQGAAGLPASEAAFIPLLKTGSRDHLDGSHSDTLHARTLVSDLEGQPTLVLRIGLPRSIVLRGEATARYATLLLALIGVTAGVALRILLQRIVVSPLVRLRAHAHEIGSHANLGARLATRRRDEIGALAAEFNLMIERLSASQSRLLETSHRAGMAELARGVLHNVGNVLNSSLVSASWLKDRVDGNRLDALERLAVILDEQGKNLGQFMMEDPRGKKVPELVAALSKYWSTERVRLSEELTRLRSSLVHVSDIVAGQQTYANSASVIEEISVDSLVSEALSLMDSSLRRHDVRPVVRLEPDLRVLGERRKLLQVLVNLLVNAKEAMHEIPATARIIEVHAARGTKDRIEIRVVDHGNGIAADVLPRLFTMGFTTKAKGNGIGLHFSALALKDMGGALRAESDGAGRGATFALDLPRALAQKVTQS